MFSLFRYLLLAVALVLSPAGHGAAMGQGGAVHSEYGTMLGASVHHLATMPCDDGQMLGGPQMDSCCVIGHCLLGLAADGAGSLPTFAAARPLAAAAIRASAEPQGNPERPPRVA